MTLDTTPPVVIIALSDPTDSIIITVTSNEALAAIPTVNVNVTAITMTPMAANKWTGTFKPIPAGTYTVTAKAGDKAGNPSTARATFAKQAVTVAAAVPVTVQANTITLVIDTTENITAQSISVTQHTENPAENAEPEIEAGIFVEIIASANLMNVIESVNIRVAYDEADIIARGIDESTLKLCLWNTTTGEWELVPGSGVNTVENYVFGTVTHLGKYGAFGTVVVVEAPVVVPPVVTTPVVNLNAPAEVLQGSNFTATVNISQVVDLNGAQYEIVFDPSVLTADNVTAGQIGSAVMPVQGFTVVSPGRYRVLQARLEPPYTVNGTGYLAVLHFHVIGSPGDNSTINLENGILSGWEGEIPASWIRGSVQISLGTLQSIAVTPANPSIALGLKQQFTANGTYTSGPTLDITANVTWASSNTSVATIQTKGQTNPGLVTSHAVGTTVITATSGNVTSPGVTLTVTSAASVEVNNGDTITLGVSQNITASGTNGIPVAVKNLPPDLGAPANGLAAFTFDFRWDKNVIRVDSIKKSADALALDWNITVPPAPYTAGTVRVAGYTTTFSTDNIILLYFGITAVGNAGNSTSVNVTITTLYDKNNVTIPARPVNAPVQIASSVAETSISQALNTSNVTVVKVNINRIKNPSDNSTVNIPGGIGSYTATVSSNASSSIQFLAVNGVSPFIGPSFNATTGVFSVASVSAPIQASNTTVAQLVPILTGNTTTKVSLTIAFQAIGAYSEPGLYVSEEHSNSITFQRGDTDGSGTVDIGDASWIAQYVVGMRTLGQINGLNAASVSHGAGTGDLIDIGDASWIAQKVVGMRDAYFK